MDNHEIQRILDDLDVQLAGGKIDIATYQTLTAKWSARIVSGAGGGTAVAAAPAPAPALAIMKIACPNCGAPPAEEYSPGRSSFTCPFCSFQFTIERAEQETEKLKKELQGWLSQLVSGTSAGSAVDASSRAFIFKEKLFPSLELEFNRSMEWLEGFREYPLFTLEPASLFREYSTEASPLRADREQLAPIRDLTAKLSAPAVSEFVVVPDDKQKMTRMQVQASELIYTANLLQQSAKFSSEGYAAARENLGALKQLYNEACDATPDEAEKRFIQACLVRLECAESATDVMARLYSSSGEFIGSTFAEELSAAVRGYQEALDLADRSGYSPMETVPWRHGVEKEIALLGLMSSLLSCYDRAAANRNSSFFDFQRAVLTFVQQSRVPVTCPRDLSAVAEGLTSVLEAKRGSRGLSRYPDWSWLDSAVETSRGKKTLFVGVNEEVQGVEQFWQPFWLATLNFSQSEGAVFKSGTSKQALLLVDATVVNQSHVSFLEESNPLNGKVDSASRLEPVDGRLSLPALLAEDVAQKALDAYARSNPALRNAKVTMKKVVYLPVGIATYGSKQGQRSQGFCVVEQFNRDTEVLRQSTTNFFRTQGS